MSDGIVFQVETSRILKILASEIYDSPLALIRENLQNAYDAVRQRFAPSGTLAEGGRIDMRVGNGEISITDNGIGMSEQVLRENFWKAGSSGKHSESARRAGVVGTFGIGAMANFGVATQLTVETRTDGSDVVLRSIAQRDTLKISEECISLERVATDRPVGTTVTAKMDGQHAINESQARQYLEPYVALLKVPVYLNDTLISCNAIESRPPIAGRAFTKLGTQSVSNNAYSGDFAVHADSNGQVLLYATNIKFGATAIEGELVLAQSGGQLMGLRSYFGLAPIPAIGTYQLGGFANLSFLQPTAGREALSRESIDQVTRLIGLAEQAISLVLAGTAYADRNNAFLQWIVNHGRYDLAGRVTIKLVPGEDDVPLVDVKAQIGSRTAHYYVGTDRQLMNMFSGESAALLLVAQVNPRRQIHLYYLGNILHIPPIPDAAQVIRIYKGTEISSAEASVLLRVASVLRDDYLIADVDVMFADISHGVTIFPQRSGEQLKLYISRKSSSLPPLLECYSKAYELFTQFMKDFVRVHIYPHVQQFVPSSTRDGVDALRKVLQRNRELYRYEEGELGDFEGVLGDYLSGISSFTEVLTQSRARVQAQSQQVSRDQVGAVEHALPDVVGSPVQAGAEEGREFAAAPPIIRDDATTDMKILTTAQAYPQLNNFTMLLGLSDRLMRSEAEFFRIPHTTRILWGGHRVVYIFTEATGRLSLYYDIELREPIEATKAGGGMFSTTTLITKKRIFVPVPAELAEEFRVGSGPKEFFVRFDILTSDVS